MTKVKSSAYTFQHILFIQVSKFLWITRGYLSGNLWGQNISYYEAQYNPFAGLLFSGFGGFGVASPYSGFLGIKRVGLSSEILPGSFTGARGNIYGSVNLFYSDDINEFDEFD